MPNQLELLAKLVLERKRRSRVSPYVLLLGAGCSLSSGAPLFDKLVTHCGFMEYEDFYRAVELLSSEERYTLIAPALANLSPSHSTRQLARLLLHGYFSVVFTTNFDDLI